MDRKVGVISDTHGRLDSRVLELFTGVDRILHAGDVGEETILVELASIAPVTAVRGNCDGFPLAGRLPETKLLDLEGTRLLLVHDVGRPESPAGPIQRHLQTDRPSMVIFGHTHAPFDRVIAGVRFFNPGAAGPRRFNLPRTVAILEWEAGEWRGRFLDLEAGGAPFIREANR